MTFSVRVALMTAVAVAIAAIGASVLIYFVVQTQLLSQVEHNLFEAAKGVREQTGGRGGGPGRIPGRPQGIVSGRSDVAAQLIILTSSTSAAVGGSDSQPVTALVTPEAVEVASGARSDWWFDTTIDGQHLHVYVAPTNTGGSAIEVWAPLNDIDSALAETRIRLALVALGGVLLAGALGAVVARAALTPVRRLTRRSRALSARSSCRSMTARP